MILRVTFLQRFKKKKSDNKWETFLDSSLAMQIWDVLSLLVTWQILALNSIFPELNIPKILVQSQSELTLSPKNSSTLCEEVLKVLILVLDLLNSTLTWYSLFFVVQEARNTYVCQSLFKTAFISSASRKWKTASVFQFVFFFKANILYTTHEFLSYLCIVFIILRSVISHSCIHEHVVYLVSLPLIVTPKFNYIFLIQTEDHTSLSYYMQVCVWKLCGSFLVFLYHYFIRKFHIAHLTNVI